jgi:hypothetical protein
MDPQPPMIQIPGADPIPAPPTQPGVTQNIIYVTVPAQTPPPQSPPPQAAQPSGPQEVHIHNTHVHNYPRRRGQRLGVSFLGTLGLFLGLGSMVAAYLPATLSYAKSIAEAGAICSALGLLSAMVLGRAGRALPFFALVVCGAGFGMWWTKSNGQVPSIPALDLVTSPQQSTSPVVSPTAAQSQSSSPQPSAQQSPLDPTRLHDHTIFGDGQGTWVKPTTPPTPVVPTTPAITPPPAAPPAPAVDLAAARTNLEMARTRAAAKMGLDYATAKLAADTAQGEYDQAKIANSPGSPDLIAASEKHLQTESQLNAILEKLRTDPTVAAAENALKAAKAAK